MNILLLALLATTIYAQNFDAVFALSWFSGFCQSINDQCTDDKWALWDHQSFTIHGLWPDDKLGYFGDFNVALLKGNLLDDLNNYWPPQSQTGRYPYFLWQHEWQYHGNDYAGIIYKLQEQQFPVNTDQRNQALQVRFFQDVINLYKRLKVQKIPKSTFTKDELASTLGISSRQFNTRCVRSGNLLISSSGLSLNDCERSNSNCPRTFTLSDWKISSQSRVTALSSQRSHMLKVEHEGLYL